MADRSFLTRLRTTGGPSHDLLVLLDQHRVMTTNQLARTTGTPERTVRYRLEHLREARLVDGVRPGRQTGSAPRHWWLRPAGARLVTGTAAADGAPSGMFVAHAAAITEVWLALTEHGPDLGIGVAGWLTDRAGWQEWDGPGPWSRRHRLTPDAVATLRYGAGTVVVFVEVDLASMTQTLLKQKVHRYLAYANDRAWEGIHPHCPPLLLLTTTPTRAATFVRTAAPILARQLHSASAEDPAAELVVAACGLVRHPADAVVEPCWMLTETGTAELTLAELLAERLDAQRRSAEWHHYESTVLRRRTDLEELHSLASLTNLGDTFASATAAEALRILIGDDPAPFLDHEPELARQAIGWADQRRKVGRFEARDLARPLVAALEARHAALWAEQAQRLLAAEDHLSAAHPRVHQLAATLAAGNLASEPELDFLSVPPTRTHQQLQEELLRDYLARRAGAVEHQWRSLDRRTRRHTSRELLAASHDDEHLVICGTCWLARPQHLPDALVVERCGYCDGSLLDWADRGSVVLLAQRLNIIRQRIGADLDYQPANSDRGRGPSVGAPSEEAGRRGRTRWRDYATLCTIFPWSGTQSGRSTDEREKSWTSRILPQGQS